MDVDFKAPLSTFCIHVLLSELLPIFALSIIHPLYLLQSPLPPLLFHLCLGRRAPRLLATRHSFTFHHDPLILSPFSSLSLSPFSLLMSKTLKSFPGMINVLLAPLSLFLKGKYNEEVKEKLGIVVSLVSSFPYLSVCSPPRLWPRVSTRPSSALRFSPPISLDWKPAAALLLHKSLAVSDDKKKTSPDRQTNRGNSVCVFLHLTFSAALQQYSSIGTNFFDQIFEQLKHF